MKVKYVIQKRYGMVYKKKPYLVKERGDKIFIVGQFKTRKEAERYIDEAQRPS